MPSNKDRSSCSLSTCILLLTAIASVGALTTQVVAGLFDSEELYSSVMDPTNENLFAASSPSNSAPRRWWEYYLGRTGQNADTAFAVFRVDSLAKTRIYKSVFPYRSGYVFEAPSFLEIYNPGDSGTLMVLSNGVSSVTRDKGDCALQFIAISNGSRTGMVVLNPPSSSDFMACPKVIRSTVIPNKVFAIGSVGTQGSLLSTSVFRIDVPTLTIDWVSHSNPGGATDIIEIELDSQPDASYLLVSGSEGINRYELSTGRRSGIYTGVAINNLLRVDQFIVAGGDLYSVGLDASSLKTLWTSFLGEGVRYYAQAPTNQVWFARTLIENREFNIQFGVSDLTNGNTVWATTFNSGDDNAISLLPTGTGIAYLIASGTQQSFASRLYGLRARSSTIIGNARILTLNNNAGVNDKIANILTRTDIGAPSGFATTKSFGWIMNYDNTTRAILVEYDGVPPQVDDCLLGESAAIQRLQSFFQP